MQLNQKAENNFSLKAWSCPTCGPGEEIFMGYRGGSYQRQGSGVVTRIVSCASCSLLYANPFPVASSLGDLYGDPVSYFSSHDSTQKIKANIEILAGLRKRTNRRPVVLDVGSGCGELMVAARLEGIEAVGTEVAPAMIEFASREYGVSLELLSIEQCAERWPGRFDGIVLNAVLEHVYHPAAMIAAASTLLKPGGILYLDVPNEPNILTSLAGSFSRLKGGQTSYNLSPTWEPYHVYGFNRWALQALLGKHNFKIEELKVFSYCGLAPQPGLGGMLKAWLANRLNDIGNLTGTSTNLSLWARKLE